MKKFINSPNSYVTDTLSGIYKVYSDKIGYVSGDLHCLVRKETIKDKVGIVTGGGSGHLPLFLGYVGDGLLDGCAVGDVFRSPNSEQVYEVTKAVDSGKGVIYIIGNYNGDIFNFSIAAQKAYCNDGIQTSMLVVKDDIASYNKESRRGAAGLFFVYKCAGAAAAKMKGLEEVKSIAERALEQTKTLGVGLMPCVIPESGKESFKTNECDIEIGVGIHGEAGVKKRKITSAKKLSKNLISQLNEELQLNDGERVSVLINGMGGTPLDELYIVYDAVEQILSSQNITISKAFVGEFVTTMEMAGVSISIIKLDDELEELLMFPANAIMYKQI
jgi:dihydroxyacetone kinase-like protein